MATLKVCIGEKVMLADNLDIIDCFISDLIDVVRYFHVLKNNKSAFPYLLD